MPQHKRIEIEFHRMREAKKAIERQLAELQTIIDRTAQKVAEQEPGDPTTVQHEHGQCTTAHCSNIVNEAPTRRGPRQSMCRVGAIGG